MNDHEPGRESATSDTEWLTTSRLDLLIVEANWAVVRRQLARGMTHEVRSPLHALLLATRNLDPRAGDEELQLLLRTTDRASERLRQAGDWLADLCHAPVGGDLEPVVVGDVVPRVVALSGLYRETGSMEVLAALADRLPAVRGFPGAIEQALLNLVLNGCDAMSGHGEKGAVQIAAESAGDAVEVTVVDDGPGVPPGDRVSIFEPFFTTRGGSHLGLGLPAAARLLASGGGRVALDPETAAGARFVVRLPVWRSEVRSGSAG